MLDIFAVSGLACPRRPDGRARKKEVEKTCIFTQNWLDHLLLITLYLVTIATDYH